MVKVAINGFGRIGRLALRKMIEQTDKFEVVAINDLTNSKTLAHLFRYDSAQGRFNGEIAVEENDFIVNGQKINVYAEKDPALGTVELAATDNSVKVYPNPFTEILNIAEVREVASVSITDMAGRVVKTIAKPTAQLSLGDLKSGMYLVTLKYKNGTVKSVKAIKK